MLTKYKCTMAIGKYDFIDCLKETRKPNGLTLRVVTTSCNTAVLGGYLRLNKQTFSHFVRNFDLAWIN